ncbi:hypothetical protein C0J52_19372 [Blattella germanica]|nr:hypothetical protein C0J52_19372 [Blattella germanica]
MVMLTEKKGFENLLFTGRIHLNPLGDEETKTPGRRTVANSRKRRNMFQFSNRISTALSDERIEQPIMIEWRGCRRVCNTSPERPSRRFVYLETSAKRRICPHLHLLFPVISTYKSSHKIFCALEWGNFPLDIKRCSNWLLSFQNMLIFQAPGYCGKCFDYSQRRRAIILSDAILLFRYSIVSSSNFMELKELIGIHTKLVMQMKSNTLNLPSLLSNSFICEKNNLIAGSLGFENGTVTGF